MGIRLCDMASAEELRERLREYLTQRSTLGEFEDWFLGHNWNAHLHADQATATLVQQVEGLLVAFSADAISEGNLLKELAGIANPFVLAKLIPSAESRLKSISISYSDQGELEKPASASRTSDLAVSQKMAA